MNSGRLIVAAGVAALTLLSFFVFPGHLYLHADTQIYLPILERLYDPGLFSKDLVATEPHVSFTIYDEVAVLARRVTGLGFREILTAEQLLFRAAGILGIFLIASSLGLSRNLSLLTAAVFGLGTWIYGPSVLTVEFEPVPRGFAVPLILLGTGLAAHGRDLAAGIAIGVAFLYQPPAVYPFWVVYFCLTLLPGKPEVMRRRILGLVPLLASVILLVVLSRWQVGETEKQELLSRVDDAQEKLQRLRASYNWISIWGRRFIWHHIMVWILGLAAFWRLRKSAVLDVKFFLAGLPLVGMLSIPVSYLLLEKMKLGLIPQFQPMRAVLFVTVVFLVCGCVAGLRAAQEKRVVESIVWLFLVFLVPLQFHATQILSLRWGDALARRRLMLALGFAAVAAVAAWLERRWRQWALPACVCAATLPFLLIPTWGRVRNFSVVDTPQLTQLAAWARTSTPKDAVFLFSDAGEELYPGIFRAKALRALYLDWKSGGQVNYLRKFGQEWWSRWQQVKALKPARDTLGTCAAWGVDILVVKESHRIPGVPPVFENKGFIAYSTHP